MAVIDLTLAQFEDTINQNEMVILDFWAEWCGPCKQFVPIFNAVSEKHEDIVFAKVNVEEQADLAGLFQVRSIPTLVFMREKIVIFSNPGMIPETNFEQAIAEFKALDMEQVRQDLEKAQTEKQT